MQNINLKPYTSHIISSKEEEHLIFDKVLSINYEFHHRKIDRPLILYGAGNLGLLAKNFFDFLSIPFLYVVDQNANIVNEEKSWRGIKVIHPDDVSQADKENCLLCVCIVTFPPIVLQNKLKENGWKNISLFYDITNDFKNKYPINNGWFTGNLSNNEKKLIKKVYLNLSDEVSRSFYLQFIAWRKLRIELYINNIEVDGSNRFFIPEITSTLGDEEVFIDCGAHKGKVIKDFLHHVKNKYKYIYAVEPDENNREILSDLLKRHPNTGLIEYALGKKNCYGKFCEGFNFASRLNINGNTEKHVAKLDDFCFKATFIKMHLEGGELNALIGSMSTIKKYRPTIAVTIYHNFDGLYDIPIFLIKNATDYNFYLRLHSWAATGAVFYAIPKEKCN